MEDIVWLTGKSFAVQRNLRGLVSPILKDLGELFTYDGYGTNGLQTLGWQQYPVMQ